MVVHRYAAHTLLHKTWMNQSCLCLFVEALPYVQWQTNLYNSENHEIRASRVGHPPAKPKRLTCNQKVGINQFMWKQMKWGNLSARPVIFEVGRAQKQARWAIENQSFTKNLWLRRIRRRSVSGFGQAGPLSLCLWGQHQKGEIFLRVDDFRFGERRDGFFGRALHQSKERGRGSTTLTSRLVNCKTAMTTRRNLKKPVLGLFAVSLDAKDKTVLVNCETPRPSRRGITQERMTPNAGKQT